MCIVADVLGPSSESLVIVTAVLVVLTLVSVPALWNRVRGHAVLRLAQRLGLVILCQVAAIGLVFAAVNHASAFFVSWSEVLGAAGVAEVTIQGDNTPGSLPSDGGASGQPTPTVPVPTAGPSDSNVHARPAGPPAGYEPTDGGAIHSQLVGPTSGVAGEVVVWTPPGYDPNLAGGYPVILALDGYPGQPIDPLNGLALPSAVSDAMAAGRLAPSIIVSATTNVDGKNWGCADTPDAPQVGTWLTVDVPTLLARDFAVKPGSRWAALGVSEGGWCAVRLALTDPGQFSAAISLSGGNAADAPPLRRTAADLRANDLRTLAAAGATPPVDLLLAASREDSGMASDASKLQGKAGTGVHVDLELLDHGGHNWAVWKQMVPPALTWLGSRWPVEPTG